MSYDLLVFEPTAAPRNREQFTAWWHAQAEWSEPHSYNDPAVTSASLRDWYVEIRMTFPNLNGPGGPTDEMDFDNPRLTDYSIGKVVIYAAFPWSQAEVAYDLVRELAVKHNVGFYDVSGDEGDGEIHFPGDVLRPPSGGAWRQVASDFRKLEG